MDNGDYTLFSVDTYEQLKKSTHEFEELAAMQAGFEFRPLISRRDGSQTEARSVMGEFVSGNYFRTFGLQPLAGRLLADRDDVRGAPTAAVMSTEAWQRDYAGDASVIGATFWIIQNQLRWSALRPRDFMATVCRLRHLISISRLSR